MSSRDDPVTDGRIAIVGMACYLPDAGTPEEFWRNLAAGRESVRDYTDAALRAAGVAEADLSDPSYVRAGVPLQGYELFDAGFFGLSPREAKVMDPQHRKFLECAWTALEDAGHTPASANGNIGVFAGSGMHWYLIKNIMPNAAVVREMGEFLVRHTANDKDFLATRVSYHLDLHGPSVNVQTACSTSLVAVHMACQSLLNGECDIALAGGSTVEVPHGVGYLYREEEVRSPDGRCRAMDAAAGGTVFGSGCGVVVLRRLDDAVADGDSIRAVVLGSAINNDGAGKASYLAPSVDGQAEAVAEAIAVAGVSSDSIAYVEAHGTATKIGDPIEVAALTQAFGRTPPQQCALGSVKTNIGHLDTAAGIAGLIKVVLSMQHRKLPPSLHYRSPNPEIDFAATPFYVNDHLSDWPSLGAPLRAGISSLGVGGTNAHVVLEEAPADAANERTDRRAPGSIILPIAAKTPTALADAARDLRAHLQAHPHLSLSDVAWTLRRGRVPFEHRSAVAGRTLADVLVRLAGPLQHARAAERPPSVVFMFPGQGAQYPNMARRLYSADADFRRALDACVAALRAIGRDDVRKALFPAETGAEASEILRNTSVTQPALFSVEYALACALRAKGVEPAAMIGHSLGEYVAACVAGVFTLDMAIRLVCRRGELIAALPRGAMVAVPMGGPALQEHLSERVALAALNGPETSVCAGDIDAIDALVARLAAAGTSARRLETSHAFHSPMLDPILEAFRAAVAAAAPRPALQVRVVSNVTGRWLTPDEAGSPDYWVEHLRRTVNFVGGLEHLAKLGPVLFVEVGPGNTLATFAKASLPDSRTVTVLPSRKDATPDDDHFAAAGGMLWAHGLEIDWEAWGQPPSGKRLPLPTYPFQRQRHWLEPPIGTVAAQEPAAERAALHDWFYVTDWRTASPEPARVDLGRVLVFAGRKDVASAVIERLRGSATEVLVVRAGSAFTSQRDGITIRPAVAEDWDRLADDAHGCSQVVYLWPVDGAGDAHDDERSVCFDYLLALAKRLDRLTDGGRPRLAVVTANAHPLGAPARTNAWQALVAGPVRTLPQEMPGACTTWLDLDSAETDRAAHECASVILDELRLERPDSTVAWRDRRRYVPISTRIRLDGVPDRGQLRAGATYLITGAFGGAGQALAEHLARRFEARLVLVARTPLPPRAEWDRYLAASRPGDETRRRMQVVRRLESAGADVRLLAADAAEADVLAAGVEALGITKLDGVFHAAGVLDDGLIALKTIEAARRVLRPKVDGATGLQALARFSPDFFIYFSSLSAQAGASGQVDYTSANAFLDAFAARADSEASSCRHIAVQWSMWRDAGMAAKLAAESGLAPRAPADADITGHPVLVWKVLGRDGTTSYMAMLTPESVWYLDQHRLKSGRAILPGTGYVELICSAFRDLSGEPAPLELVDLKFHVPLILEAREQRLLRIEILPIGGREHRVVVTSRGAEPDDVLEHVTARVFSPLAAEPLPEPLPKLASGASMDVAYSHPQLVFGPRWSCLRRLETTGMEAALSLAIESAEELAETPWHPALLDMAIGAAQRALAPAGSFDRLLPYRYERLIVFAPLTASIESRVRGRVEKDSLWLDVDVRSPDGTLLVIVRGFEFKASHRASPAERAPRPVNRARRAARNRVLEVGFADALSNAEAMRVLELVAANRAPAQLAVAPRDLDSLLRETRAPGSQPAGAEAAAAAAAEFMRRPDLATPYVAPQSETERKLVELWETALEIRGLGVHDNFFELGGHSLLLTKIVARLRKDSGIALPLEAAFENATVAAWGRLATASARVEVARAVRKADRAQYRLSIGEHG